MRRGVSILLGSAAAHVLLFALLVWWAKHHHEPDEKKKEPVVAEKKPVEFSVPPPITVAMVAVRAPAPEPAPAPRGEAIAPPIPAAPMAPPPPGKPVRAPHGNGEVRLRRRLDDELVMKALTGGPATGAFLSAAPHGELLGDVTSLDSAAGGLGGGIAIGTGAGGGSLRAGAGTGIGVGSVGGLADVGTGTAERGPDAGAVRARVQGAVRYPRQARVRGLEGTVIVRFHVGDDGQAEKIAVVHHASPELDEEATAAVARAAPYEKRAGWVRVPVVFSLDAP